MFKSHCHLNAIIILLLSLGLTECKSRVEYPNCQEDGVYKLSVVKGKILKKISTYYKNDSNFVLNRILFAECQEDSILVVTTLNNFGIRDKLFMNCRFEIIRVEHYLPEVW